MGCVATTSGDISSGSQWPGDGGGGCSEHGEEVDCTGCRSRAARVDTSRDDIETSE